MADYTAIAIGIDRYQFIQPLSYAQDDARAVYELLREDTALPADQSLLMTDSSPWLGDRSTQPSKENILQWLDTWLDKQETSLLWFFFSGYGVSWQGVDYLMPIDGNPADIPGTGIPARELFDRFRDQGFGQVLALLDINRSPGVIAGEPVGSEIAQFVPEMGYCLILSSQLEESSHEAVALGHGMFAAALLEALRYFGRELTLHDLSGYLHDRLPELSEHHWRPVQHPLIVIPEIELAQQPLLPHRSASPAMAMTPTMLADPVPATEEMEVGEEEESPESNGQGSVEEVESGMKVPSLPNLPPLNRASESENHSEETAATPAGSAPSVPAPRKGKTSQRRTQFMLGGGVAALLVILAFLWFGRSGNEGTENATTGIDEIPPETVASPSPAPETSPVPANPQNAPAASPEGTPAPEIEPEPPPPPTEEASRSILARARTYIQTNQASGFSRGIQEAQKIQPGAPLYDEAQQDISRWSRVILDIAKGRAAQGNFDSAIAAAQLVPPEQAPVYADASQSIDLWTEQKEQQRVNQGIINTARRQINFTQASSYSQAISELEKIPPGQPGYLQAQELTRRWSRQIYLIANSRASRGAFQQAITTARLVPEGTPHYDDAQKAIARWQKGER